MVTPPRVAHLTSAHPAIDERILDKECRALVAAGLKVIIVGPSDVNGEVNGVRIIGVPTPNGRLRRMTTTVCRVIKVALSSGATVCHFHDPELIPAALLLQLLGRKVIYDVHEDYPRNILTKDWIQPIVKHSIAALVAVVEAVAGWVFDGIVAATPTIAARFPKTKTVTVCNFPLLEEFSAVGTTYAQRPFRVCYIGGLQEARGLFDMIEAAGRVRGGAARSVQLAGRFSSAREEAQSRARPAWAQVDYLGWLDRASIARLLANVRAGLVVLHSNPSLMNAYPIKMFEYMAAGLPVVASDFPVYREILDDGRCGLLIPAADPLALARAIEWIFVHPDEAQAMGERGRRRVATLYTWQAEREKLLSLYCRLAGPPVQCAS
jgi:glycosyltransferase involved in cell wall biosynthesis